MTLPTIGLLGVGRMGDHIGAHLAQAGYPVQFFDPAPTAGPRVTAAGGRRVPRQVDLAGVDFSMSLLPDPATTRAALTGADGLFRSASADHVHILMGTVGPTLVEELVATGAAIVDAPVSGSVDTARKRELTAIVGCAESLYQTIVPILAAFCRRTVRVGAPGAAAVAKLAVNSVTGAYVVAVAEALALAQDGGVDLEVMYDVLLSSVMTTPFLEYKQAHVFAPQLPPDGPIHMVEKDLDLALQTAAHFGTRLSAAHAARELLRRAGDAGWRSADVGAVFTYLRGERSA